jgi:hypothetical protein
VAEVELMLLNPKTLLDYLGEREAPVVLKCPKCEAIFTKREWWDEMQERSVVVSCGCGYAFALPRFNAADFQQLPTEQPPTRLLRRSSAPKKRNRKLPYGKILTAVAIAGVGAAVWHARRRPSGGFEVMKDGRDD